MEVEELLELVRVKLPTRFDQMSAKRCYTSAQNIGKGGGSLGKKLNFGRAKLAILYRQVFVMLDVFT